MSFPKNIFKDNKKKIIVLSLLFLSFAAISISVYAVSREVGDIRSFAKNPSCNSHNDCPPNWMYCIGGECYSYTTGPGVGSGCSITDERLGKDTCGNAMLHCINGKCQRVVGEPGGCSTSYDCVKKYKGVDDGRWSCTNGQCIKVKSVEEYHDGEKWVKYGSSAACVTNYDCGPGAICDEGGCHFQTNKEPCSLYGCGAMHPDPNKRYVCVGSSGEIIEGAKKGTYTLEGGTCVEMDVCDSRLITCGPGTHCESITDQNRRYGKCRPDEGTVAINNEPPDGWYDIECEDGELIERCSNSTSDQRVRYCSNNPDKVIRWNYWRGANDQRCVEGGEIWGDALQSLADRQPSNVPKDFYDPTGCLLGTRIARCSNINEGQLVSYCSTDEDNPERSIKRFDNWVGPNGETCSTEGMVLPDASVETHKDLEQPTSFSNVNPKIQPSSSSNSQQSSSRTDLIDLILQLFFNSKQKPQDCPGDVNKDGVVDREDFLLLADNWYSESTLVTDTKSGKTLDLDLYTDGIIDIQDVKIVIDNFGCTVK